MDLDEFNNNYLNILLDKLSKQSKSVFFLADFDVGLFKYNKHTPKITSWTHCLTYASTPYCPTN